MTQVTSDPDDTVAVVVGLNETRTDDVLVRLIAQQGDETALATLIRRYNSEITRTLANGRSPIGDFEALVTEIWKRFVACVDACDTRRGVGPFLQSIAENLLRRPTTAVDVSAEPPAQAWPREFAPLGQLDSAAELIGVSPDNEMPTDTLGRILANCRPLLQVRGEHQQPSSGSQPLPQASKPGWRQWRYLELIVGLAAAALLAIVLFLAGPGVQGEAATADSLGVAAYKDVLRDRDTLATPARVDDSIRHLDPARAPGYAAGYLGGALALSIGGGHNAEAIAYAKALTDKSAQSGQDELRRRAVELTGILDRRRDGDIATNARVRRSLQQTLSAVSTVRSAPDEETDYRMGAWMALMDVLLASREAPDSLIEQAHHEGLVLLDAVPHSQTELSVASRNYRALGLEQPLKPVASAQWNLWVDAIRNLHAAVQASPK